MFWEYYNKYELLTLLLSREEYLPYPRAEQRDEWNGLPHKLKEMLVTQGEKYLNYEWIFLPATQFMEFKRSGDRKGYETLYFSRREALLSLIIAECAEYEGRFTDDIINGIWAICEESIWGTPANSFELNRERDFLPDITNPIIDLGASETAGLLTWGYYLLKSQLDRATPIICKRIELETKRRILDPFLERDDFWWMGFEHDHEINNWNPWINSNCLAAFLVLEEDSNRRAEAVYKAMKSLDRFTAAYHPDGGCDEGTSYWGRAGASLFDCLELFYNGSDGQINFFKEPLIKEMGRFIYRSYINEYYFINFADGGAKVEIPSDLVYRYGKRIEDPKLMAMGSSAHHLHCGQKTHIGSLLRVLPGLFNYAEIEEATEVGPYMRDVWMEGIQVMAAREQEGSHRGLYLAAKGGHNDESHNHNDIGQFIIYADGKPAIIDIGVETYTAKTFSPRRYEIWTMQSVYHNLPTINGIQQAPGGNYKASKVIYTMNEQLAELSLDISKAYPETADIESWSRICRMNRGEKAYIEVIDDFVLNKPTNDITISLMTPLKPQLDKIGFIVLKEQEGISMQIQYNDVDLIASWEYIGIEDDRLGNIWGNCLYRIILKSKNEINRAKWTLTLKKV